MGDIKGHNQLKGRQHFVSTSNKWCPGNEGDTQPNIPHLWNRTDPNHLPWAFCARCDVCEGNVPFEARRPGHGIPSSFGTYESGESFEITTSLSPEEVRAVARGANPTFKLTARDLFELMHDYERLRELWSKDLFTLTHILSMAPICRHEEVEGGDTTFDDEAMAQTVTCNRCRSFRDEIYVKAPESEQPQWVDEGG